jgi:hypothetical protein
MAHLLHITFEKLTGLKGDIEGDFLISGAFDLLRPIVFVLHIESVGTFFTQDDRIFTIMPVGQPVDSYAAHFEYGMNLLVKEARGYGSGVDTGIKNPN